MRIAVLGATGRTGRHVIELALAHGHDVTAFARTAVPRASLPFPAERSRGGALASAPERTHGSEERSASRGSARDGSTSGRDRLAIVVGNPLDPRVLAEALPGHDAVISVLGPRGREGLRPSTLVADCARGVVAAMRTAGVDRLAIVSAAVLFPQRGLVFAFFRWLLRHHARDLADMERQVRASGLAWTIVRPGRLVDGDDAACRTAVDAYPAGGKTATFRAVAGALLAAVERRAHVGEIVGLAR